MGKKQKRGPSAYNTAYDEFPDDLSIFPPYMSLWIVQIMLMLAGGAILIVLTFHNFISFSPVPVVVTGVFISLYISTANFMIIYGYATWIIPLQVLSVIYTVAAIPHFFYEHPLLALIPFTAGALSMWITMSDQFRLLLYDRVKAGEWRRDQLEKNKIRREVLRERKAQAKANKAKPVK